MKTLIVGQKVRYKVSRPGGVQVKTGTVYRVYANTVLVGDPDSTFLRSVRKADVL